MSKAETLTKQQLEATLHVRTRERDMLGRHLAKAQERIKALEEDLNCEIENGTDQILALRDELRFVLGYLEGRITAQKRQVIDTLRRTLDASLPEASPAGVEEATHE